MVNNRLFLLDVPPMLQYVVKGYVILILLAVALDKVNSRHRES